MDEKLQDQIHRALNRAYFYLKFRPRTKKEVGDYLQKKSEKFYHWPEEVIPAALSSLQAQNFINDKEFVEWFIQQRNNGKPKGQFVLRNELMRYGIEKELIDQYFEENEHPEAELAYKVLQSKWSRFKYLDKKERFQKAAALLSRRGFSFEIIKRAISDRETKNEE